MFGVWPDSPFKYYTYALFISGSLYESGFVYVDVIDCGMKIVFILIVYPLHTWSEVNRNDKNTSHFSMYFFSLAVSSGKFPLVFEITKFMCFKSVDFVCTYCLFYPSWS